MKKYIKNNGFSHTTTDISLVRKNMYDVRRSILPEVPKFMQDVHTALLIMCIVTNRRKYFMPINENKLHYIT